MINIEKLEKRVNYLKEGKRLLLNHLVFGKFVVYMNPQQNRIFAEPLDDNAKRHEERCRVVSKQGIVNVTHEAVAYSIEKMLLWDCGEWSLIVSEPRTEYVPVFHEGKYEKI